MYKERLISALIATLLIVVFQPFGLSEFGSRRWLLMAGLMVIITICCLLSEVLVRYLFRMKPVENATPKYNRRRGTYFQICNMVIMPILIVVFLDRYANNSIVDNHLSLNTYLWALAVGLATSFVIGLYWSNVYMKRHLSHQLQEAQLLNGMLMERARQQEVSASSNPQDDSPILIEGSTKEHLELRLRDFLYAEAEGNYVMIHHLKEGAHAEAMIRTSMKNVVATLCTDREVLQCHRAFVVNLRQVEKIESRTSGIGLLMKRCGKIVPVSKGYANEVKELIKNPLHS